ncbi:serine-type D-Ala-D-Ala carboxypeptidase [Glaesserella parasuis]|uniref:serine-type D-Ala-D-Ala carboxypeptidase n=1 Tax=Glaesserella parasuis TaxID=738 RepID=UPI00135D24CD|nr:serine-type D-Ala-D-Ala carboxypeptidase [Glaesserella parasuis]MCT8559831.1 serine-type D-Ala-D-Ala carboxypeptidase [Glaesserella parasuis]MCT8582262.1 serine-type D-Ala-D-Ala carboxypeptidase [Glaesserella parasuis]MCT8586568.1 serine-type D-Ala-D-Ala carboxypeptidase [Glaesserella parasuis]MCT8737740.1 serine-type D-Ala-D-Ala carboxypeptidase [Glaesserella parasuis]MDE3988797.1 serine-type D-Ala-D-Ala carboxypeptidase [Glaesserella parasuis]
MISFSLKQLRILLLTLFYMPYSASAEVDITPFISHLPKGTSISVIAKNLSTDQIVTDYQSDLFMLPASTQKVFTALASKIMLNTDFKFQTALLTNGIIENGVLEGDLIAKFTGDPTLTSGQLFQLISQLKEQGIHKISGNLIIDTSVFASHDKAIGWVWNDLSHCFSAPSSAVNIDQNCFYVNLDANQSIGSLIKISVPSAYPVQVFSSAYVADKSEANFCELDVVVHDNNRYYIKGCLSKQTKPVGLSFAVQDTTSYGGNVIKANLKRIGIQFNGNIQQQSKPQQGILLAEHHSASLQELIKKMMKKSDNQIADALFRTIANKQYHRPISFSLASYFVRNSLKSKANIEFNNSIIADGSGLSRHNLVNARTLLQALEVIARNEPTLNLFETFPIAGVDGTLSARGSMSMQPLAKNVIAKTGALKGVYNLAGFMTNAKGERIAFVQFINGYSTGELESKTQRGPLTQFEYNLFMALYNN